MIFSIVDFDIAASASDCFPLEKGVSAVACAPSGRNHDKAKEGL